MTAYIAPGAYQLLPLKERILESVADEFGIQPDKLKSVTRITEIVRAREVCWLVMNREGFNKSEIARFFDKHHTTVMHGLRQIEGECEVDGDLSNIVSRVLRKIQSYTLKDG